MRIYGRIQLLMLMFLPSLAPVAVVPTAAGSEQPPAISSSADRAEMVVFCAAGATDVVTSLCREYEAQRGVTIKLNFASSSTLARQIEAGAQADLYISANRQWMDYIQEKGLVSPGTRRDWATNRLVLVIPCEGPSNDAPAWDGDAKEEAELSAMLSKIGGKIAVGDPDHVPAGIYAKQALDKVGLYDSLKDQFVACPSVRAALRLVEEEQVEAGIVYQSDAVASQHVTVVDVFPQAWHEPITFRLALLRGHHSSAVSLADFLCSALATGALTQFGFDDLRQEMTQGLAAVTSGSRWHLTDEERSALWISLKVALVAVGLLTVPGILLGYVLARKQFTGKVVVEGLVHAPLVLPPIVTGYLLLLVLGNNGIVGRWLHLGHGIEVAFTLKAAAIASAVVALPLMVRSVRVAMMVADRKLEQASYTLGAGPVRTFLLVSLPLAAPGVIAGMVLAFARSLGEFGATAVFMGNLDGQRTLPLAIYSTLQTAHGENTAWRLVAISIVVSMMAVMVSEVLAKRATRYLEQDHVA